MSSDISGDNSRVNCGVNTGVTKKDAPSLERPCDIDLNKLIISRWLILSNIPNVDKSETIAIVKAYLLQYDDWELVSFRLPIAENQGTKEDIAIHNKAVNECNKRMNIIKHIQQEQPTLGMILYYRFIKRYTVKRTQELLAQHGYKLAIRTIERKQQQALLLAYKEIKPLLN